jgi:DNA polymerase
MPANDTIGLDFETYSPVSLPDHGLDRYVNHPEFRVLIGAVYESSATQCEIDFVSAPYQACINRLERYLQNRMIAAHNAAFEQAVLRRIGIELPFTRFIDTAVIARAAGAASKLEAAAPQLLGGQIKMDEGRDLIKLFSIPGKLQAESGSDAFDPKIVELHPEKWTQFMEYCGVDAQLSYDISQKWRQVLTGPELDFAAVTMQMNQAGWPVDIQMVHEMQARYEQNKANALEMFRQRNHEWDLNLNSFPQLKKWCEARGVKAKSFDEKHVESMLKRLKARIATGGLKIDVLQGYVEVVDLLETKQVLGGSSLTKLQTILDHVGDDGRLRDQYLHAGAGQTLRTSGRTVQMQNLKRLSSPRDMDDLLNADTDWSNTELAQNLRQVFTSSDPYGKLIVGDFSSVESRGLAYLARENWKLQAYRQGKDLYKVLAATMFAGKTYDTVTKEERQTGKVGELSCGYGAGPGAVLEFAKNMGVEINEGQASRLVHDWRFANPKIVEFWAQLDDMLHRAVEQRLTTATQQLPDGLTLTLRPIAMPESLAVMHQTAISVEVMLAHNSGPILKRYFHGCHMRGRDIVYYRPSDRKTGDLWKCDFIHPKTKQRQHYKIYGGKLAGILTQSLCRELFFWILLEVSRWVEPIKNLTLIGQFHDEDVLDWTPHTGMDTIGLAAAIRGLENLMQDPPWWAPSFPLAAEVKYDYRYTK